jgi:hypothetical protein
MPDQPKKGEKDVSADAAGNGNGGASTAGGRGEGRPVIAEAERLNDLLLGIIEREIGRGEPRRPEEWATLRELAVRHSTGTELVETFRSVIDRCNDEMINRLAVKGLDLRRLRESVVMLIRISLAKKLGLAGNAARES